MTRELYLKAIEALKPIESELCDQEHGSVWTVDLLYWVQATIGHLESELKRNEEIIKP